MSSDFESWSNEQLREALKYTLNTLDYLKGISNVSSTVHFYARQTLSSIYAREEKYKEERKNVDDTRTKLFALLCPSEIGDNELRGHLRHLLLSGIGGTPLVQPEVEPYPSLPDVEDKGV